MSDKRDTRFLLGAFSLGHLCNDWPPSAIWILAPAIALSLDLSPAELGLLFTLHSLGAARGYRSVRRARQRVGAGKHGRLARGPRPIGLTMTGCGQRSRATPMKFE